MTSMDEQETTVTGSRADDYVQIYSTNTVHLKKLRAHPHVVEKSAAPEGSEDDWGSFIVPTAVFDPLMGFRRAPRTLTDDQRKAQAERMQKARAARGKA